MGSEQSSSAPTSLVRRLGRWARGDEYMVGAYPPEWQERARGDAAVVPVDAPNFASAQVGDAQAPAATAASAAREG